MKNFLKSTTSLLLVIFFLIACMIVISFIFVSSWLHTYSVFTQQKPVATLSLSEQKIDENGPYVDVTLDIIEGISPTAAIFSGTENQSNNVDTTTYKLYGDFVYLGGPIIKFEDFLTLLNFEIVYKIGQIEAEYTLDLDLEKTRTEETFSTYELNGGIDGWRNVTIAIRDNTFQGQIYSWFIDSIPQIDKQGVAVLDTPQEYTLCVTEEGFFFCEDQL